MAPSNMMLYKNIRILTETNNYKKIIAKNNPMLSFFLELLIYKQELA